MQKFFVTMSKAQEIKKTLYHNMRTSSDHVGDNKFDILEDAVIALCDLMDEIITSLSEKATVIPVSSDGNRDQTSKCSEKRNIN
jgi:hypothetical protein